MTTNISTSEPMIGVEEAARRFSVGGWTIRRWIKAGRLPAVRLPSGGIRIRIADLAGVTKPVEATADAE